MKIAKTLHEVSTTMVPPAYAYLLEEPLQTIVDLPNFGLGSDVDVLRKVADFINAIADDLENQIMPKLYTIVKDNSRLDIKDDYVANEVSWAMFCQPLQIDKSFPIHGSSNDIAKSYQLCYDAGYLLLEDFTVS